MTSRVPPAGRKFLASHDYVRKHSSSANRNEQDSSRHAGVVFLSLHLVHGTVLGGGRESHNAKSSFAGGKRQQRCCVSKAQQQGTSVAMFRETSLDVWSLASLHTCVSGKKSHKWTQTWKSEGFDCRMQVRQTISTMIRFLSYQILAVV